MRALTWLPGVLGAALIACGSVEAAGPPLAAVTVVGPAEVVFSPAQACDGSDVPDANARAFRDETGSVVLFASHYASRAMRGASLASLRLDCRVALPSGEQSDPALYNDRNWLAATWTDDGRHVAALVHHEYQANEHEGRCRFKAYIACWYNTVTGASSVDGGVTFQTTHPPSVVAAAPFRQEVGQGRHRGFFNPSNIVGDGSERYMFAATTGWNGQNSGACLFRTRTPQDPTSWRAWDGQGFSARFGDPYRTKPKLDAVCRPIDPFPAPMGAVVRHRPTGAWIAVFQAKAGGVFPESGIYTTSSADLLAWDKPRLLIAGKTLYDDPCGADRLINYPSLLDTGAQGRNFDDVGDEADLYMTVLRVEGCKVKSDRSLIRRRVTLRVWK